MKMKYTTKHKYPDKHNNMDPTDLLIPNTKPLNPKPLYLEVTYDKLINIADQTYLDDENDIPDNYFLLIVYCFEDHKFANKQAMNKIENKYNFLFGYPHMFYYTNNLINKTYDVYEYDDIMEHGNDYSRHCPCLMVSFGDEGTNDVTLSQKYNLKLLTKEDNDYNLWLLNNRVNLTKCAKLYS